MISTLDEITGDIKNCRKTLHYVDLANKISEYQKLTDLSERKIASALEFSKSEIHRLLTISKVAPFLLEAAKNFNIEKYVLIELGDLDKGQRKIAIERIIKGELRTRRQLHRLKKAPLS